MRTIGIITDAHANLPALKAALAALDAEGCKLVVHTGDAIGIGPHPAECLELLLAQSGMRFVMGNHDEWFAHGLPDPQPSWMSDEEHLHQQWTHRQLTAEMREAVASWPYAIELEGNGVVMAFCHYPRDDVVSHFVPIVRDPSAADLDRLFADHRGEVVFYGHHHPRSDVQGRARYVNPGALGCNAPGEARFAMLTVHDDGNWNVSPRSVPYDASGLLLDYEQRNVPARETILRIFHAVTGSS
jgi:predicted phosphodiesterase